MTTVIVGGGWSGLAAAIELSQSGEKVIVVEAAKQLGGRARNTQWHDLTVDNGQHLLIGAYQHTFGLFKTMGLDPEVFFERKTLDLTIFDSRYPPLRLRRQSQFAWPLSLVYKLIRDNGLPISWQILRLGLAAYSKQNQADNSVADWLAQHHQSTRLIQQLWEPLCLATLNTPLQHASAKLFANVLLTTFRQPDYCDLLLPRCPLGNTLPDAAASYLKQQGQVIRLQTRVTKLLIEHNAVCGVQLHNDEVIKTDSVIVACHPENTARLLPNVLPQQALASFPICTVYLKFPAPVRLKQTVIGFSGTLSQWAFDRTEQSPGVIAIVISGPGQHETLDKQTLSELVHQEIKPWLSDSLAELQDSLVIREKRATFASSVDIQQQRPNNQTGISGLWLAGDIVNNPYPATLEGAVSNGIQTAKQLADQRLRSR